MTIKVGINGFGRIGRSILRASGLDETFADIEIVGINDLTDKKTLVHLLKYDSVMGVYDKQVETDDQGIIVDGRHIAIYNHRAPSDIPWSDLGVEYVIESTGRFTDKDKAQAHIEAGARKVVISAPAKGDIKTIVMGVNEDEYDPTEHHVVSNASCTTNCLAPMVRVILDRFGIKHGLMNTIHAYTNDQRILDFPHTDLRRARAAALSMIEVEKETTVPEVNQALKEGANRYLGYSEEPLVSIDYQGNPYSSVVDADSTKVIDGTLVKVLTWYDNEWGYSNRVLDLILHMEANKPV
jgi:glyceraldehyde 3-phosphate dehydrogenase